MAVHPRQLLQHAARAGVAVQLMAAAASNSSDASSDVGTPGHDDIPSTAAIVGGEMHSWDRVPVEACVRLAVTILPQGSACPSAPACIALPRCPLLRLAAGRLPNLLHHLFLYPPTPAPTAGVVGGLSVLTLGLAAALIFAVARIYGWSPLKGARRWAWDVGAGGRGAAHTKSDVEAALELARPLNAVPSIVTTRLAAGGSEETALTRISDVSAVRGGWAGWGGWVCLCKPSHSGWVGVAEKRAGWLALLPAGCLAAPLGCGVLAASRQARLATCARFAAPSTRRPPIPERDRRTGAPAAAAATGRPRRCAPTGARA